MSDDSATGSATPVAGAAAAGSAPRPGGTNPARSSGPSRGVLGDHALRKRLRVLDIWALGVGVVITGEYFGWNLALKDNGPIAVLVASLLLILTARILMREKKTKSGE